jgi:RNA polymerase sigma factor (sigma-70 family)
MDDALLVSRAMAGDLDSFGQLYDRYFTRIYDFAWRILRDADEAADVTQDVFMKAMQGLGGLGKASSFKSWLFTIAHNTAVTRAERAGRTVPLPAPSHEEGFGAFDVPDPCRLDDPEVVAGDHELASLVWEAATALNPRDYALLDLHVRQGLESAEIAGVMGVSKGNAYTMVSRMKTAAADVIGSYVVARRGSQDCEGLQTVLAEHEFPPYTEPVRRAVDAHIKDCEACSGARKRLVAPLEIFGAFAAVPAPMALKGSIWGNVAGSWYTDGPGASGGGTRDPFARNPYGTPEGVAAGVAAGALAAGAGSAGAETAAGGVPSAFGFGGGGGGGFDSSVAPMSYGGDDEGWNRNRILLFAGAALGLLIFAFAGGALIAGGFGGGGGGGGAASTHTTTATRTSTPQGTLTAGVSIPSSTPAPPTNTPGPATATAEPTETPPPLPTDTPAPVATATPTPPRGRTATPTREPSPTRTPRGTSVIPTVTPTPCSGAVCPTPAP